MKTLFDSYQLGAIKLPNRIVMAPLTRSRSGEDRVPNDLMRDYYVQRATAGFILTEATAVTPMGVGYADTPGIWSEEQTAGWKKIVDAVHAAGGRIVIQLWHVGRISDPHFLNGATPVAPSALAAEGHVSLLRPMRPFVVPRALEQSEIKEIVEAYKQGAINAKAAGFDGVEVHGANGYLPEQFLQSGSNQRTDEYGGSIENRARFMLEITDAILSVWPADRVGMHLSPAGTSHGITDANPKETWGYVAQELGRRKLAFLFLREERGPNALLPMIKERFGGTIVANMNLDLENAETTLAEGAADLVSFGRLYISNPDLVERLRHKKPLTPPDTSTFYAPGPKGYVDYPAATE